MNPKVVDTFHKIATRSHRIVFRASKGRIGGSMGGMRVLELTTTGRRSGKPRTTMLTAPIDEPGRLVLVASFGGDDRNPAWYHNLCANPKALVTAGGRTTAMVARVASDAEKAELWPRIVAAYRGYDAYQRRTSRPIPVVVMEPATPS